MLSFCLVLFVVGMAILTLPMERTKYRWRQRRIKQQQRIPLPDMGLVVTEVATRLRCGASAERAWELTLAHYRLGENLHLRGSSLRADNSFSKGVLNAEGIPYVLVEISQLNPWQRFRRRIPSSLLRALPATFAVCRLGNLTGAPLAEVLDACAAGITEAGEAQAARGVALAGTITSARILAILPFFGFLLGYGFGVDVVDFLCTTRLGRVAFSLGVAAEIAGIVMVKKLVEKARQEEI